MLLFREALRLKAGTIHQESRQMQIIFATILYNVGMIHFVHGDDEDHMRLRRALQSFQICLDLRTKALGRRHPDVASALHNIGILLLQDGQQLNSLKALRESLEIRCHTLGPNHHEVASSFRHIGRIYQDRGEHEKALRYFMKAFVILQRSQENFSDELIEVLMGLGQLQHCMGRLDRALATYEQVIRIFGHQQQRGKKVSAHRTAQVLNIMGNLAVEMSNFVAASDFFAKAASLSESSTTTAGIDVLAVCAAAA